MPSTDKTPEHQHAELQIQTRIPQSPIYAFLLPNIRIISASKNHFIARLPLTSTHMNSSGSLHGAVSATIIDWAGGMAIATNDLRTKTGVSVDIHITYQSGAKLGQEIEIEGVAERVGGTLAFTRVGIYKVVEKEEGEGVRGDVVATGTHTKFVKGTERVEGSS